MLIRRITHERIVEKIQAEMEISRREAELTRVSLLADLRDVIAEDIEASVRSESREERSALVRHHGRYVRLLKAVQCLLPEARRNDTIAVFTEEQVLAEIRNVLRELEEESSPFLLGKLRVQVQGGFLSQ